MTFKPRPWQEPRAEQTPAQAAATERNFRIFRLRGLWHQMYLMTGPRRAMAQELVDMELAAMGADDMETAAVKGSEKSKRKSAKQFKPDPRHEPDNPYCACDDCIPF